MSCFLSNVMTGTLAAGAGTAGLIATGIRSETTKAEHAAAQAIEEVQLNTQTAPSSLEGRTVFILKNPLEISALPMHKAIAIELRIPTNKELINTTIDISKRLLKTYLSILSLKSHVLTGTSLVVVPTLTALHYLGGRESEKNMKKLFEKGYLGIFLGTQMTAVFTHMFQTVENPGKQILLSSAHGLIVGAIEFITNRAIAPGMGAAMTSTALTLKAVETMGDAAEGYGGFILASAGGTAAAAMIALASKRAKERGGDGRVATWACSTAMCLWLAILSSDLLDPENMSVSDTISAWMAVSVLSGLIAATVAQVLPRGNEQNR